MPMLDPSCTGLATTGNSSPTGPGASSTSKSGVGTPALRTSRLAAALSSVTAMVSASLCVQGTPSISQTAGTWASRARPPRPSARLKTRSGGPASIASKKWRPPPSRRARLAVEIADQVVGDPDVQGQRETSSRRSARRHHACPDSGSVCMGS